MKKRKRILSLVFAACLVISGFVPGAGVQKAEAAAETEVIDHGLRGISGQRKGQCGRNTESDRSCERSDE